MGPGTSPGSLAIIVGGGLPPRKGALGVGPADRVLMMLFGAGLQYLLDEDHWAGGLGWVLGLGHTLFLSLSVPVCKRGSVSWDSIKGPS